MNLDEFTDQASKRHKLFRRHLQLTTWHPLEFRRWAIVTTVARTTARGPRTEIVALREGEPNSTIANMISSIQDRVDQLLLTVGGARWEDAYHEGCFVSLISDVCADQFLTCRARLSAVKQLRVVIEDSCIRVRAGIAAPSTELPRFAWSVDKICSAPAVRAA